MQSERRERRSALGLGPLETAIMRVLWDANAWLTVRDVRDRMDYAPVAYTTVARVTGILHDKALLVRRLEDRDGGPGSSVWWYHAARPMSEEIGELIAKLLGYSPTLKRRLPTLWPLGRRHPRLSRSPRTSRTSPGVLRDRAERHRPDSR